MILLLTECTSIQNQSLTGDQEKDRNELQEIVVSNDFGNEIFEPCISSSTEFDNNLDVKATDYAFNVEINIRETLSRSHCSEWEDAISSEVDSLLKNGTWDIVDKPAARNIVGYWHVLTIKHTADGTITKRKAWLAAQSFTQQPGVDFVGTFAPVTRLEFIQLVLALAAKCNLTIHQIDIDCILQMKI